MWYVIIGLLVLGLLVSLLRWLGEKLKNFLKVFLLVAAGCFYLMFWKVCIPLTGVGICIWAVAEIINSMRENQNRKQNKRWAKSDSVVFTEQQIDDFLLPDIRKIFESDKNKSDYIFLPDALPYGRINAFLNYFGKNIYEEEPYYYSSYPSQDDNELREYGIAITRQGIYISEQRKTDSGKYEVHNRQISFIGLKSVSLSGNRSLTVTNVERGTYREVRKIVTMPINLPDASKIINLCQDVISHGIGRALLVNCVRSDWDMADNQRSEKMLYENDRNQVIEKAGTVALGASLADVHNETKNLMNGSQGGGYAAEYANNTVDRLLGRKVEAAAQNLDGLGRQIKGGADRIVDGVEIQTKYYQTGSESIAAAFQGQEAVYIRSDGSGKMMQIEVPRDQYRQALKLMQKRIDDGQVPGVEPGESAADYVRMGFFTYSQAWNVAKAGAIESLFIDMSEGVIASASAGGITALLVFSNAIWEGEDVETAMEAALNVGVKILGKGAVIYTLTKQLSRAEFANPFVREYTQKGVFQGQAGTANLVSALSEDLASRFRSSSFARSRTGQRLGLDVLEGKVVIANSVTAVVMFGPDLCRVVQGRISFNQLLKNSAIGAGAMAGGAVGQALIPIPVVGGMIGGGIAGFIAKNILDGFIEDDAKKMFRILKEEFLDIVVMSQLTTKEVNQVTDYTIGNKELIILLQDMYASGESRRYAREAIVNQAVVSVLSQREKITVAMQEEGLERLLENSGRLEREEAVAAAEETPLSQKEKTLAIVSLVLGLASLLTGCMCIGGAFGIGGVICGHLALERETGERNTAISGMMTSVLGMIIALLMFVSFIFSDMIVAEAPSAHETAPVVKTESDTEERIHEDVQEEEPVTKQMEEMEVDYLLPESGTRYLSEEDLAAFDSEKLRFARNEIYARHGRLFQSEDLNGYFNRRSWYRGYLTAEEFDDSVFNEYEKANLVLIQAVEAERETKASSETVDLELDFYARYEEIQAQAQELYSGVTSQEMYTNQLREEYKLWDDLLNECYQYFKQLYPFDMFENIRDEQREWLKVRDAEAEAAKNGVEEYKEDAYYTSLIENTKTRIIQMLDQHMPVG